MWIARDKDGQYNGFLLKPQRVCNGGFFKREKNAWSTDPLIPVWINIPPSYVATLDGKLNDITWESEPVEIKIVVKQ